MVQGFKKEFHAHIYLEYIKVKFLSYKKKKKKVSILNSLRCIKISSLILNWMYKILETPWSCS